MSSLHWEWTKTLHQLLKKVVKWISGSETIVTDCVCSSWEEKKKHLSFNEQMHLTSQNITN